MNSWKLGSKSAYASYPAARGRLTARTESKDSKDAGVLSRSITPVPPSRSQTPRPPGGENIARSGMLTIRIFSGPCLCRPAARTLMAALGTGRGLALPPGVQVPDVIQRALESPPPARRSTSNRDSMQRQRLWYLPYVVLEFDKNEVLVDGLAGDLSKPEWRYRADL